VGNEDLRCPSRRNLAVESGVGLYAALCISKCRDYFSLTVTRARQERGQTPMNQLEHRSSESNSLTASVGRASMSPSKIGSEDSSGSAKGGS
jgi:hypothetical protein